MLVSFVLIIAGIVFIYLNSLSKQKSTDQCHRCGASTFGRKCVKCGYENYNKDDAKSNSFMSAFGVIFIIVGVASLMIYMSNPEKQEKALNYLTNVVDSITEDEPEENNTEPNDFSNIFENPIIDDTQDEEEKPSSNTTKHEAGSRMACIKPA